MNKNTRRLRKKGMCSINGTGTGYMGKLRSMATEETIKHGPRAFKGYRAEGKNRWLSSAAKSRSKLDLE